MRSGSSDLSQVSMNSFFLHEFSQKECEKFPYLPENSPRTVGTRTLEVRVELWSYVSWFGANPRAHVFNVLIAPRPISACGMQTHLRMCAFGVCDMTMSSLSSADCFSVLHYILCRTNIFFTLGEAPFFDTN